MINWFDMPAEGLSNGGLFEVKELEVTENGTYEEKGEMYNKVTVNVEGGGGSSDFSTAEVTIVGNTVSMNCAYITEYSGMEFISIGSSFHTGQYTIPLYKGMAVAQLDNKQLHNTAVTGNATIDEEGLVIITGDFTITIS